MNYCTSVKIGLENSLDCENLQVDSESLEVLSGTCVLGRLQHFH